MFENTQQPDVDSNDQQSIQQKTFLQQASGCMAALGICIILTVLGLIAGTIVLALIPVYLKASNSLLNISSGTTTRALTYNTNMNGLSGSTISNLNGLTSSLQSTFQLTGLSVSTARFVGSTPISAKKKRQTTTISANSIACQSSTGNTGNFLYFEIRTDYYTGCKSSGCHTRYDNKLTTIFSSTNTQFTLPISLSNGSTFNIVVNFCSLDQFIVALNCSNGLSQSSNLATATLPATLAQFVNIVGSFFDDSWYTTPGPVTIGSDNQVGSIRTFLDFTGTIVYNETLLVYNSNTSYFELKWKGPGDNGASIDFGTFVLGFYVERLTGVSTCGGSAVIVNFGSDFCGSNLDTAITVLGGVHASSIEQVQALLNVGNFTTCSAVG